MAGDLTLTSERQGRTCIIHVVGELDLSTAPELDEELSHPTAGRVVVVLTDCTFIDSSALRSLVRGQQTVRERGGELVLVAPSEPARRVLSIAAFDRLMRIVETVGEAVSMPPESSADTS